MKESKESPKGENNMILSKCVDKIIKIDNVMNIYLNNGKRQLYLEYNNYNNNIKNIGVGELLEEFFD
ncbi:hypothetical protein PFNF135_01353 [Plasmodium falciparum NF135/5.C10]|uniref:Uncharacterized protein n=1 Tax=Plasmodium falciparum NF135/5.C10 TaxID=1036726 RepID=W4ILW6_PLAFA|nr:hypothetical protein PFNF135_01353 [Plasmodium falciparum NF135/5.C10]